MRKIREPPANAYDTKKDKSTSLPVAASFLSPVVKLKHRLRKRLNVSDTDENVNSWVAHVFAATRTHGGNEDEFEATKLLKQKKKKRKKLTRRKMKLIPKT